MHQIGCAFDQAVSGTKTFRSEFERLQTGEDSADWCRAGMEDVRRNVLSTGYDPDRLVFVQGKVEDTLPATLPGPIAGTGSWR